MSLHNLVLSLNITRLPKLWWVTCVPYVPRHVSPPGSTKLCHICDLLAPSKHSHMSCRPGLCWVCSAWSVWRVRGEDGGAGEVRAGMWRALRRAVDSLDRSTASMTPGRLRSARTLRLEGSSFRLGLSIKYYDSRHQTIRDSVSV